MCGIGGLFSDKPPEKLREAAELMCSVLNHRGPDGNGVFIGQGIALSHTRLSIIDLSNHGAQPMSSPDGRFTLSYNGELYNYLELKAQLEYKGHQFTSASDSEVMLKALIQWGTDSLHRFNGMFALALWDAQERQLLLARDRYGIKPLYYCQHKDSFAFASEIKALLSIGVIDGALSTQALGEYLYYGHTQGRETLFRSCRKLEAGSWLRIRASAEPEQGRFWSLRNIKQRHATREDTVAEISSLLSSGVKRHLAADVPVGLFLSGGLDSSTLCSLASEHYAGQLQTFSVDFEGASSHSELAVASEVANASGTRHHELHIGFNNLPTVMEALNDAHDQPFGDAANIPLYLLTRELGNDVKVVLQGDGGDEIFGGYRRYRLLQRRFPWILANALDVLPKNWGSGNMAIRRFRRMAQALGESAGGLRGARLLCEESFDHEVFGMLSAESAALVTPVDPFQRYRQIWHEVSEQTPEQAMLWTDTRILLPDQFLEKVDRATMANGVEVRVPFLDNELTDYVMGIPASMKLAGSSKSLLRSAMKDRLPESVLDGPKLGFGVPYSEWLKGPLAGFTRERLLAPDGIVRQLFDESTLSRLCSRHTEGKGGRAFMMYKLLMLSIWSERSRASL